MKVEKVTWPLLATLFLSGNGAAMAGPASALDPYAYVQAPTRAEREQAATKRTKKFKVKKADVATRRAEEPAPRAAAKPATVIISENSARLDDNKAEKESKAKTASADTNDGGFLDGIKQSTDGIAKSTRAVGSSMVNGTKSVGSKIAAGFKVAGEKVKDGTSGVGEKLAVVPKKIGEGAKSAGEKVKDGSSGMGEKVGGGFKAVGGALAGIPAAMGSAAGKVGESTAKLNPFHKDGAPTAVAAKPKSEAKSEAKSIKSDEEASVKDQLAEDKAAKKFANEEAKEEKALAKKPEADSNKVADRDGGLTKKLVLAPKAGLDKTKASVGALSHSFGKLNPFHKGDKAAQPAPTATASKQKAAEAPETAAKPKTEENSVHPADAQAEPPTQLGERIQPDGSIQMEDSEQDSAAKKKIAAPEGAVPQ